MLLLWLAACTPEDLDAVDTSANPDSRMEDAAPLAWGDCRLLRDVGVLGDIDAKLAFSPSVIGDQLWYAVAPLAGPQAIAHARLQDGEVVEDRIVLEGGQLGGTDVSSPAVIAEGEGYRMFLDAIVGGELGIWSCRSADGLRWEGCQKLLGPHQEADAQAAQIPFALPMPGGLRLWYTGVNARNERSILTAFAADGERFGEAELAIPPGFAGALDATSAYSPFVFHDGQRYRMLYAGRVEEEGYLVKQLIELRSEDALRWEAPARVLQRGCAGAGDAWRVDAPWVVPEGEGYRLYYDGFDHPETSQGRRRLFTARSL